jgi:hypothetical protein
VIGSEALPYFLELMIMAEDALQKNGQPKVESQIAIGGDVSHSQIIGVRLF